eukprot:TRINITY_DN64387_c0_g1_i1.p1 TRINITY_DN64387_c0_g1~~TRINITY_DN64387_c0_g1_i1.p1  ORF type:complete len:315 (-),score=69.81 TRINITY_DN64387_c0_g1_i1:137-994(-)
MPSGGSEEYGTQSRVVELQDDIPPEKSLRSDRVEKTDKGDKSEKPDKADKGERSNRGEKTDKGERAKPGTTKGGLNDETLNQVAQSKFEAQEEKLREVARHAMAFLRDYPKLGASDCAKRVAEIRKSLMRYEMQYLRVCELQERRRREEILCLDAEAARCREEAVKEVDKIVELRDVLEKEKRRRKRYEGYEEAAAEVNRKKTRMESQAEIDAVTNEISRIWQHRAELDGRIKERSVRAQLLRQAVAELSTDLRNERECVKVAVSGNQGGGGATTANANGSEVIS